MSFQDLPVSTPHPSTGVAARLLYPSFHVGARDQNSGSHDYALPATQSPQPCIDHCYHIMVVRTFQQFTQCHLWARCWSPPSV